MPFGNGFLTLGAPHIMNFPEKKCRNSVSQGVQKVSRSPAEQIVIDNSEIVKYVAEHRAVLAEYAKQFLPNPADADDVVSNVLLHLVERNTRYVEAITSKGKFLRAVAFAATRNAAKDTRKAKTAQALTLNRIHEFAEPLFHSSTDWAAVDAGIDLARAMDAMPERSRKSLAMTLGGCAQRDACQALGVTESAHNQRVNRGYRALVDLLGDYKDYDPERGW